MTTLNPFKSKERTMNTTTTNPTATLPDGYDDETSEFFVPQPARPHWDAATPNRSGLDAATDQILYRWAFEEHPEFEKHASAEARIRSAAKVNPNLTVSPVDAQRAQRIKVDARHTADALRRSSRYDDARQLALHRARLADAMRLAQQAEQADQNRAFYNLQHTCELCGEVKASTWSRSIERSDISIKSSRHGVELVSVRACEACTLALRAELSEKLTAPVSQAARDRIAELATNIAANL